MKSIIFLISIFFSSISCNQDCYEVIQIKEIEYDITGLNSGDTVSLENKLSENEFDYENDYRSHIFNSKFSYSSSYYGEEVIERQTNRRFVKRRSDFFEEKMRYEDNPTVVSAKPTGKQKQIGPYLCEEYIYESNHRPSLLVYVSLDHPFTYEYLHPDMYPGFVVARQMYKGGDMVVEEIYEIREIDCDDAFFDSIKEVKELLK